MSPMWDGRTTNDEQGKIGLLSQMDAGWLSFAIVIDVSLIIKVLCISSTILHLFILLKYCRVLDMLVCLACEIIKIVSLHKIALGSL